LSAKSGAGVPAERGAANDGANDGDDVCGLATDFCLWLLLFPLFLLCMYLMPLSEIEQIYML
jgi:hypothetical protein